MQKFIEKQLIMNHLFKHEAKRKQIKLGHSFLNLSSFHWAFKGTKNF